MTKHASSSNHEFQFGAALHSALHHMKSYYEANGTFLPVYTKEHMPEVLAYAHHVEKGHVWHIPPWRAATLLGSWNHILDLTRDCDQCELVVPMRYTRHDVVRKMGNVTHLAEVLYRKSLQHTDRLEKLSDMLRRSALLIQGQTGAEVRATVMCFDGRTPNPTWHTVALAPPA